MQELREDTFFGNKNEDAHDHFDRVFNIVSLFNIPRVSKDAVLLRVFPFSLTGSAKRWVDRLTLKTVNTWDLLKKAFIPRMTPTQARTAIQTMADRSQKWHDGTSSRKISSSSTTDELAAVISKLDKLGRDMKNLKENVHSIQGRCQIYERPHLHKECPLNEEVKQVDEVKYGEFRRLAPFNESNGAKFRVVNADHETPNIPISLSKLKNLNGISFLSDSEVAQNEEERTIEVLQCQLPPKELNLRNFTLLCTIGNLNFYGMADLGSSINVMSRNIFGYLRLANPRNTNTHVEMADMTKKAPLDPFQPPFMPKSMFLTGKFHVRFQQLGDKMSRDVITVGSTMRIPLLYRGEYSQWRERFMNYLEEQTDGEAMINSIQNGDQPLPVIAQVSLGGTAQNAPPTLKDLKFWTAKEKKTRKIDRLARTLLIQGLPNDIYSLIDSNKTAKDLWDALER
uniref:Retrotransposon gag domain-containing protein n=1 Tax=Tanacetum cinerariifolium TaxID=118510 RepID=A0A699GVU1_TANCI|nr:hypothetical protein [Tanacetum cinerariifolium]